MTPRVRQLATEAARARAMGGSVVLSDLVDAWMTDFGIIYCDTAPGRSQLRERLLELAHDVANLADPKKGLDRQAGSS